MNKNQTPHNTSLKEIISYTLPELYIGKEWYVGFYAFDPSLGKMRRKKIKINFIKGLTKRRKYGEDLKKRVTEKLLKGWNPWIEAENHKSYHTFQEVVDNYQNFLTRMSDDDNYRIDTHRLYSSNIRNIVNWNLEQQVPITYIFQFNADFCNDFLEHIFIEKNNTASTRNNYLTFLRVFSTFCIQHRYFTTSPVEGITNIANRQKKQRAVISNADMIRLSEYLTINNKYFLLAAYILGYCFIRPREMTYIQLNHISLSKQTIFIPNFASKNRKDGIITLPSKVISLMLELDIFNNPSDYYLFSNKFAPGAIQKDSRRFRRYWDQNVRTDLNFPPEYKFYSLKDTGITNMLRQCDTLTVRDQARHSSISMTDKYTPKDCREANDLLKNHEGAL